MDGIAASPTALGCKSPPGDSQEGLWGAAPGGRGIAGVSALLSQAPAWEDHPVSCHAVPSHPLQPGSRACRDTLWHPSIQTLWDWAGARGHRARRSRGARLWGSARLELGS